jgi:SAM-dependent methyltransferase
MNTPPVERAFRSPPNRVLTLVATLAAMLTVAAAISEPPALPTPPYEHRSEHSPDGIGVLYLGREIAHVMSHAGGDWLERPERADEERPDLLIKSLRLRRGEVVADLGAGTGYYTWRLAEAVTPAGLVYAVDIQPEMLARLRTNMITRSTTNVVTVLGSATDPRLPPASLDLVLMVDVYHEFDRPYEMLGALCDALKPSGRIAFVEYRGEDPAVPIKPLHKMTEAQIRKEAVVHPLEWVETISTLPWQHVVIFRKRTAIPSRPLDPGS